MPAIKIVIFILIAVAFITGGKWYNATLDERVAKEILAAEEIARQEELKALSILQIKDLVVGTGSEAKKGDTLSVNYLGEFLNGEKFDSSYDRNQPLEFVLGDDRLIRGWNLGIAGMKIGGKRTLVVPPEFGYGVQGSGPIPPSSTLKFTVELLGVNNNTSTAK
ncbi:MAG: FKBP-type peptidyl-prolyl cis-trans isomerase [Patescibacteria group bacterium]